MLTPTGVTVQNYISAINGDNPIHVKLVFSSQGITLDDQDIDISKRLVLEDIMNGDTDIAFGKAVMKQLTVGILNSNRVSSLVWTDEFDLEIGVDINGTTNYVKVGTFIGKQPQSINISKVINFTATDRMVKFDTLADEFFEAITYPTTVQDIYDDLCTFVGVTNVSGNELSNIMSRSYAEAVFDMAGYTCRDILSWIAEACGCYAKINANGNVQMVWFSDHTSDVSISDSYEFDFDCADSNISAIDRLNIKQVGSDADVDYPDDTGVNTYRIINNPFLSVSDASDVTTYIKPIYDRLDAFGVYLPSMVRCVGNWLVETGDIIEADINGSTVSMPVFARTLVFNGNIEDTYEATGNKSRDVYASDSDKQKVLTAKQIELIVGDKYYERKSGITIDTNGVRIFGSKELVIDSGGSIDINSNNFIVDSANRKIQSGSWRLDDDGLLYNNVDYPFYFQISNMDDIDELSTGIFYRQRTSNQYRIGELLLGTKTYSPNNELLKGFYRFSIQYDSEKQTSAKFFVPANDFSTSGDVCVGSLTNPFTEGYFNKVIAKYGKFTTSAYVYNSTTTVNLLMHHNSNGSHGVSSTGYWDGSSFHSSDKWLVYRDTSGNVILNGNANTATKLASDSTIGGAAFWRGDNRWGNQLDGILVLYAEGTTAQDKSAGINFKNKDTTTGQTNNSAFIYSMQDHNSTTYGQNLVIHSGGNTVIGAGESAANMYNTALIGNTGENMYVLADSSTYVYAGSNTIANRIGFAINTSGHILPQKAESANNNAQNLGASNAKWANVYATTFNGDLSGNATTCTYPIGFSARNTNATWGDQTGATVTSWNEADGGSIDFRKNNPSSGKLSIKVDGRFYGNEGTNPAMLMNYANGYWGIGTPDGNATDWIRLSNNGIIPYQGGSVGSGHGSIGTSTWFFSTGYIDTVHSHQLIVEGATNATMTASSTNPRITFQENTGTQPVHLIYSDWDSYRAPAGLKVIGGSSATPAWFEVEGDVYATTFVGALSGNATSATTATSAALLYYTHTNEINFKGGRQANCYFNWRNADDDSTGTRTQCTYYFGSYGGSSYASDGIVKASKVYNAVWNDYAECRKVETLEPGRCVTETESGTMAVTTKRLQPGCKITSDTFGSCMGETAEAKTPIAVAGRVLVYPYKNRKHYHVGDAVCSAPNGTVDVMTRREIKKYPERIVGIVSEIPTYDKWQGGSQQGHDDIEVNGRIWVYVR